MVTSTIPTAGHTTAPTTAAPRSASPFVVIPAAVSPAATPALPVSTPAVLGTAAVAGMHADQAVWGTRVVPTAKLRAAGIGTKQDRPPRGEPR